MSSWRDSASAQAQQDLDVLLSAVVPFAQRQLASRKAFLPYAAGVRVSGATEMVAVDLDSGTAEARASDMLAACFGALADMRGEIRAGAVVSDVRTSDGGDAIRVDLEHVEGHALAVLVPYSTNEKGGIDYGQIRAEVGLRQIWV